MSNRGLKKTIKGEYDRLKQAFDRLLNPVKGKLQPQLVPVRRRVF
jgi:hypothetical protein